MTQPSSHRPSRLDTDFSLTFSTMAVGRGLFLLVVTAMLCTASCRSKSPKSSQTRTENVAGDQNRFPHVLHTSDDPQMLAYQGRGLVCNDCHPQEEVEAGRAPRPGGNDHSPCDECHKEEFYKEPGSFCLICHESVDLTGVGATKMQPFPGRGFLRILASNFSHQIHSDSERMETEVGFHVSCNDCHKRDADTGEPMLPGHETCVRCHTGQSKSSVRMSQCADCHVDTNLDISRSRILITPGLTFEHGAHVKDRQGAVIGCQSCHASITSSQTVNDVSIPPMQECAKCHQDPARTPERVRIARCEVCHENMVAGNPPRTHLSGASLPENHSLEFRANHSEQAADKDANCQYCHENLNGNPQNSCFQCHEIMRPRDHRLGWRNDSHGREASSDRDRCATCHTEDYCTACHTIVPSSHQPLGTFSRGGHAQSAQFGLSSCMACHTYQDTCSRCHRGPR